MRNTIPKQEMKLQTEANSTGSGEREQTQTEKILQPERPITGKATLCCKSLYLEKASREIGPQGRLSGFTASRFLWLKWALSGAQGQHFPWSQELVCSERDFSSCSVQRQVKQTGSTDCSSTGKIIPPIPCPELTETLAKSRAS